MTVVGINGDLLDSLVKKRGGIQIFLAHWSGLFPEVPDRASLHRWIKFGTLPRSFDDYLGLCVALDVDPVCLLVAEHEDTSRAIEHLLSAVQIERWRQPALRFLADFFGRQKLWPPPGFARAHYGRDWHVAEISHDPKVRANYYATIELKGSAEVYGTRPQVVHVAFRIPGFFRERWLEFGAVQRFGEEVGLFHINGYTQSCAAAPPEPALVETWFGPGPAVFRLASLHPFSAMLVDRPAPLRFPG
jgi:hypothetical protein